jgi:integrase
VSLIDDHLNYCVRRNLRPTYLKAMRGTLERLDRDIGPLELLTEDVLEDWWNSLDIHKPGTRVVYAAHLSSFYRWLVRERIRADNPADRLIRPRVQKGYPRPIRDESLRVALDLALPPVSTWLLLGALQGLRACEIATLCREDVRDGVLVVRDGKGGRQRILPLHPLVGDALRGLPKSGPLFRNKQGQAIAPNTVTQRANRFLHACGVTETLHTTRHRFGTKAYQASHDLRLTQELLGHASPITTALYAAWEPARAAAVVGALELPA